MRLWCKLVVGLNTLTKIIKTFNMSAVYYIKMAAKAAFFM